MKKIIFLSLALASAKLWAISIDWSGGYRIEYNEIDRRTSSNKRSILLIDI